MVAGEVGEAHSTVDCKDNITLLLGKGLYFREAFMDKQLLDIDLHLKVKPSVTADEKVRVFQRKLYLRAKQDKSFKAYSLYDKICQPHVLHEAWRRVKSGKQEYDGGGVDKVTFGMIEKDGVTQFLTGIQNDLANKTYRPQAIRRVMIDKAGSKEKRPLGIPTIRDRVVQIKWHLDYKLYKWLKSKGRKAHKTLRQRPFDNLVKYKHLLDIEKYASLKFHAKATGRTLSVSRMSE